MSIGFPKINESHPLFSKCNHRAAWFQKWTTRALSKAVRIWKQKKSQKKNPDNFSQKTGLKEPKGSTNNEEMLRVVGRQALVAIFQVMRVAVNYCKGQKVEKIALHLKSTLASSVIYDGAYAEKLDCFFRQFSGRHEAQFSFLICTTGQKSLEEPTSLKGTCFCDKFRQKIHGKLARS